mgnify:CR=1 FL=1
MGHQPTTFNESLSQLRRGIAVAWLANVLVLQLSIVACAVSYTHLTLPTSELG